MKSLFCKRVLAFLIDYTVIIIYAVLLFLGSTLLQNHFNVDLNFGSPIKNQTLSFFTLTLPVFLYFFLSEKSNRKATIGKKIMGINVAILKNQNNSVFLRNFFKFLPWEIAHIGVHQIVFYESVSTETWFLLILPQIIVCWYLLSVIMSKGKSSFYDKLSNTEVTLA